VSYYTVHFYETRMPVLLIVGRKRTLATSQQSRATPG